MTILIAGCGYLGKAAAGRLLGEGHRVIGLTRSPDTAEPLAAAGIEARSGDIAEPDFVRSLPRADAVVHSAASGRGGGPGQYRRVYVEGARQLLAAHPGARFIFTSSSSVYAQIDGSWVTEDSPAVPDRETGRLLREAEDLALAAGGTVLRLAGIYGPDRSVLLKNFLLGEAQIDVRSEPPATPDGRWINQIHREDAAAAIAWAVRGGAAAGVFNVADHTPLTQRFVYTELARRFDLPLPPEGAPALDRKRGWTHKRVSSRKLTAAGWTPRFPSWFDALDHDPALVPSVLAQMGGAQP
jgi:nucleoside-diphosphate-sugar epimerase